MEFGVPKEVRDLEMRVGLTPAGALALVQAGHTVYVEREAGAGAGFSDNHYLRSGAKIVYSAAEAYGRADVIVKVTRPTAQEHRLFRYGQTIFSFLHLPVSSPDLYEALVSHEITAIAYEMIGESDGFRPILHSMSEIAGRLAPVIAGQLLMNTNGGRGTLLSGIPGVPPAAVVILGAGTLGLNATRAFVGLGAQVTVLDQDLRKLQLIDELYHGHVTTMLSSEYSLNRVVDFADVLVGCILSPGRRAPILVTREMVRRMRPGSVIIDFSIDQGGCVETSRPTTLRVPTFISEGTIHYCVPNLTASVARTTSNAITNASLPFLLALGAHGLPNALSEAPALRDGVNTYEGKLANADVAATLDRPLGIDLSGYQPLGGTSS
ncbi:MAG: alanine dehydrogenase [Candidatus Promineifilaceae bacterium]